MKKTILLIGAMALSFNAYSQVLQAETFDNLTLGNVGTVFDGSAAGQGGFLTFASNGAAMSTTTTSTNAGNSNFQIATIRGASDQSVNITSPNGNEGSRFMWQDGLDVSWTNRSIGNDIIDIEFTFNTGPVTTSRSRFGMTLYNTNFDPIVGYFYSTDTGILTGQARLNSGGENNFNITLATGGLTLNADTRYTLGMSYNTVTGEVLWKVDPNGNNISVNPSVYVPNLVPLELDFVVSAAPFNATANPPIPPNTLEATRSFFDFKATAVATSNLLSNEDEVLNEASVKVYPNPANNILTVSSPSQQLSSIEVVDLNGRIIKSVVVNNTEVNTNIEDLKPGLYILNILSNDATITRKFIKE